MQKCNWFQAFEFGLAQYLGSGVAACYRGTRIFDSPETRAAVQKWVDFYKRYRMVLTQVTCGNTWCSETRSSKRW